jgi:glycosyltransferase involved in cell wall biosynthesis
MPEFSPAAPHILVISNDQVDTTLAGPGARYLELARHLGQSLPVTLAVPNPTSLADPAIRLASYSPDDPAGLKALVEASQVTLLTPFTLNKFPFLAQARARLVVDLYDPFLFENLHYHHDKPPQVRAELDRTAVQALNRAMQAGDFFLCASQRQRDFYLGLLAANGRINAHTFAQDASLEKLIAVVGLGFPERPPASQPFLRGVHPAFPPQARIVVWGGGIWDWLDPLSLVQAWPQVIAGFPQARLVFLGTRHPNPEVPIHRLAQETQALAARLGEVERSIFFFEWLPAAEREALLSEADVGVALHPAHVETRFSIRTRVLDYFWARLPVLVSAGDVTSEWVGQLGLGRVVPPGDVQAVAEALNELLAQPKAAWAPAFAALPEHFRWAQVIQPLREYCLAGQPAADHQAGGGRRLSAARTSWRGGLARAIYLARTQGAAALIRRAWRLLQARLAR